MKIYRTDHHTVPLPDGHRFPMHKYALLRRRVEEALLPHPRLALVEAPAATRDDLILAHDAGYIDRVWSGTLTPEEVRRIGFPWSPSLVERCLRSCGATVAGCFSAAQDRIAVSLAGGTHHAFADRGEGYCVFNDAAVAARRAVSAGLARQVVIVDCDVHQGNGTAAILRGDPSAFTFSIHGEKNFPFHKEESDLDVGLPDGADDATYLEGLEKGLEEALRRCPEAGMAIYLAGADPLDSDKLGRLQVSRAGLARRDELVLDALLARDIKVVITMAGGYGHDVEETVAVHLATVRIAATRALSDGGLSTGDTTI